jgi:hypothetical protein
VAVLKKMATAAPASGSFEQAKALLLKSDEFGLLWNN